MNGTELIILHSFGINPVLRFWCTEGIWITNIWITDFKKFSIQIICYPDAICIHLYLSFIIPRVSLWSTCIKVNSRKIVRSSDHHSNNRPFSDWTTFNQSDIQIPGPANQINITVNKLNWIQINFVKRCPKNYNLKIK